MELVRIGRRIEHAETQLAAAIKQGDTWAADYCRRAIRSDRADYARACQANRKG